MLSFPSKINQECWRADMYRILAAGLDTPSEENLKNLKELLEDLVRVVGKSPFLGLLKKLQKKLEGPKAEFSEEYHRLFVTKSECPVSEGSYRVAERGPILGDVTAFYKAFQIRMKASVGPPDSIKMELAFMHAMALKKIYALEKKLSEEFQITEGAEKKFLQEHLGCWVFAFTERLCERTEESSFYRILGDLLALWIQEECDSFQIVPFSLPKTQLPTENENCMQCHL